MDAKNRALCFMYRHPPAGQASLSFPKIADKVFNKEGGHPTAASVRECVTTWNDEKKKRGRTDGMYMRCNGPVSKSTMTDRHFLRCVLCMLAQLLRFMVYGSLSVWWLWAFSVLYFVVFSLGFAFWTWYFRLGFRSCFFWVGSAKFSYAFYFRRCGFGFDSW